MSVTATSEKPESESIAEEDSPNPWFKTIAGLLLYIVIYFLIFREFKHVFLLLIVIVIHEFGHFFVMKNYGYKDVKMFFIPLIGAYVSGQSEKASSSQKAIMILAGPMPGILIGIILFCIYLMKPNGILLEASALFLLLNVFNLLPVSPLDGGQLLQTIYFEDNYAVQTIFLIFSIAALSALSWLLHNYFMLAFVLYLLFRLKAILGQYRLRVRLKRAGADLDKNFDNLSPEEHGEFRNILLKFYPDLASEPVDSDEPGQDSASEIMRRLLPATTGYVPLREKIYFTLVWLSGIIFPLIAVVYFLTVVR